MNKTPIKDLLCRESEKPVLEALYLQHEVATDQLRRDARTLQAITVAFNRLTARNFDANILLRYMFNRRKQKDWPTLGSRARKFESVLNLLTGRQLKALEQIYISLDIASDELLFTPTMMRQIAQRFHSITGEAIPGSTLVAVIVAKRKRGEWVELRTPAAAEFADIREVANTHARR